MGKKNKKKLQRMMRANAQNSVRQQVQPATIENSESTTEPAKPVKPVLTEEDHEVKKEIRKILITIGIMVLAIVAVYFINIKSDIILHAGQWMVGKLNLSI